MRLAQEVRSILFTSEEIHAAVTQMLVDRVRNLQPFQVEHVTVQINGGVVSASVRFCRELNATRVLDPHELMCAILAHCRRARIPLSSRSQKRLGVVAGCLSLTMSLNFSRIDPWIDGDTVIHAGPDPKLLAQRSG